MNQKNEQTRWIKVLEKDELPEGRVKTCSAGTRTLCLTHHNGEYGALDNHCPHQGGPLGEGSIENGMLRCPWHGWDYDPLTGESPGGYDERVEGFPVEVRADGVYVGLEPEDSHVTTVSDIMVETMVAWGVTRVFGLVGHSCLGLADACRRQAEKGNLEFITVRHEGAAAFAASAYAKLTGKPAACLTIAGPGATNLLTGLWDARVDRAPVLALTGQVDAQVLGPGAFQEVDLSAAFASVTAFSQTVLHKSKHAELVNLALKSALLKRDVAHLIFPDEVQTLPAGDAKPSGPAGRLPHPQITPAPESIGQAVKLLSTARRPIMIVGHGARFHREEVRHFAEEFKLPVLTTFKGKGVISDKHELGCGVLGRSGTPIASWFMNECDLILVLGASFSNHTGITDKKPTIQVDYDEMALGKFHAVDVPVWGEIGTTLEALSERLRTTGTAASVDQTSEVAERWKIWRTEKQRREQDTRGQGVSSASIFATLNRTLPDNAVICVDVGNNTYSFGRYFEATNQSVLMSGYLGSIGFGYPAAMGAWAAAGQERPIVAITGDGGFGQYLAEVTTAVKYGMNITHILLNNSQIGKIAKEQRAGDFEVWQTDLHNPNFADFVKNCGGLGLRVESAEDLEAAVQQALAFPGPATVEIISDPELI